MTRGYVLRQTLFSHWSNVTECDAFMHRYLQSIKGLHAIGNKIQYLRFNLTKLSSVIMH